VNGVTVRGEGFMVAFKDTAGMKKLKLGFVKLEKA